MQREYSSTGGWSWRTPLVLPSSYITTRSEENSKADLDSILIQHWTKDSHCSYQGQCISLPMPVCPPKSGCSHEFSTTFQLLGFFTATIFCESPSLCRWKAVLTLTESKQTINDDGTRMADRKSKAPILMVGKPSAIGILPRHPPYEEYDKVGNVYENKANGQIFK